MPMQRVINKLATAYFCDKGGEPKPKLQWLGLNHSEIIQNYNKVVRGIFNYYSFVDNLSAVARIYHILRSSCAKLLATKYKLKTQRKVYKRYGKSLKALEGSERFILRTDWKKNRMGFKENTPTDLEVIYYNRLTRTLIKKVCAICSSSQKVEMHHVKHIRTINKKLTSMEKGMVSLNRKQIPVCRTCHMDIHKGKYDGVALKEIIHNNK
jgi:hypothetical protein